MRWSTVCVVFVVVAVIVAGCTAPARDVPGAASDGDGPAMDRGSIESVGCTEQTAVLPQEASRFEALLPDGFTLEPVDPEGGLTMLIVIALRCDIDAVVSHDLVLGLPVVPPEEVALVDATWHMMPLRLLSDNPEVVETWKAWGLGDLAGSHDADFDVSETPAGRAGTVLSQGDGDESHELTVIASGEPAVNPAGQGRAFIVHERTLTGAFDVEWDDSLALPDGAASLQSSLLPGPANGFGLHAWGDWTNTAAYKPLGEL